MSISALPQPEAEEAREPAITSLALPPEPPRQLDPRGFDPTYGVRVGSDPYDDPTQGRAIGSQPYDDPTRGR